MNVCALGGNLVRDGEIKFEKDGRGLHVFTLAVNKSKKINGVWSKLTSYLDCSYYASVKMQEKLLKGHLVTISGEIIQQRWKDKTSGTGRSKIVIECKSVEIHQKRFDNNSENEDIDPTIPSMDDPTNYDSPGDNPYPTGGGDASGGYDGPDFY